VKFIRLELPVDITMAAITEAVDITVATITVEVVMALL